MNQKIAKNIIIYFGVLLLGWLMYKYVNSDSLIRVIYQSLPPQEAGLLSGIILGQSSGMDKKFWSQLSSSGVIHMVVVSGTNVIILSSVIIENLAGILGRKKAIIFGLVVTFAYVQMVGWEVPVVRAALLVAIYYWAQILGRKYSIFRSLILTLLIILIADYRMVFGVSFWLSFLAFLAIIFQFKEKRQILDSIKTTLWVSIWITPILSMFFGKISIISFLSNALVVGLIEVITLIGGLGVILGLMNMFVGKLVLISIYPLLKYFVLVTETLGNLVWASVDFKFNIWMFLGWYLILGSYILKRKNEN